MEKKYTDNKMKWTWLDSDVLSGYGYVSENDGEVVHVPSGELPSSLIEGSIRGSGMAGLHGGFLSGYPEWIDLRSEGLSAIGEMTAYRIDETGKFYMHIVATDGINYYWTALDRHFHGHWQSSGSYDIGLTFGHGYDALSGYR